MSAAAALNRLTKWRSVFASWQLGTRSDTDPECRAVKDHRELTILLRAEVSVLTGLLLKKGVFSEEEFEVALENEADELSADYSKRFPGMEATEHGIAYDIAKLREHGTMDGWLP
jgi:hypothetical protein